MIKEIFTEKELLDSLAVIRESFRTVADEFRLTVSNCPTHPSFMTLENLKQLREKGVSLFGLFLNDVQIGFVAVENSGSGLFFIEKLAVLPRHRHDSNGARLIQYALDFIRKSGGTTVSIGIIGEHAVLKEWYGGFGFVEREIKRFSHLPFTVCIMEKSL
ncbi:MAG TPA: GNAT family N-acetyltransferase [Spirochaetota bacterium]|nr:GNAT family N-acetyltransferase [Spirochaetota bacterium]HRZ28582.1 GNAT family N-acetyltransferase [Spirochaetota bacterium]HSA16501.1 GNAT family N-acetyltransferase [Spirochaetota bacterium]